MLFNSYIFIFLFFPICLIGYYSLLRARQVRAAKVFLIGMSFWFYGYFNLSYLLIMVCSIGGNYIFHRMLSRRPDKRLMVVAVAANLGVLFYFKYVDFFLSAVNGVFGMSFALRGILLPLGISFFTFQQISFVVDTYSGEVKDCPLIDYALFVAFFPQLIAGPIVSHDEMLPQFRQMGGKAVDWEQIARGLALFILGMTKKVLLADTFGAAVDYGYGSIALLGRLDVLLVQVFYLLQIYFDFSGYCDMARGIGWMLGMEITVNFDSPYKAVNIAEFWRRWHMTLNRFFTRYVYIPLGGNRKGQVRMYGNLMIVFLLSGLWHGAGWTYLVWGMLHGILYVLTRWWLKNVKPRFVKKSSPNPVMTWVSRVALFLFLGLALIYFRSESIGQAHQMFGALFHGSLQNMTQVSSDLAACFQLDEFWYVLKVLRLDGMKYSRHILMWLILVTGIYLTMIGPNAAQRVEKMKCRIGSVAVFAVLAVWCVLTFSEVSIFLYYNF